MTAGNLCRQKDKSGGQQQSRLQIVLVAEGAVERGGGGGGQKGGGGGGGGCTLGYAEMCAAFAAKKGVLAQGSVPM